MIDIRFISKNTKGNTNNYIAMDFTSDLSSDISGLRVQKNEEGSTSSSLGTNANESIITKKADLSSDIDTLFLSKDDKRRLKLEESKEKLLAERERLMKQVDDLKIELDNTPLNSKTFEPEEDNKIDENIAKTLVDLMTFSSRSHFISDGEEKPINERIDGTSDLQDELTSKYDTLPLLNMNLRLRYLKEYLYPFIKLETKEKKDVNVNKEIEVTSSLRRNKKCPITAKFQVNYDTKDEKLVLFDLVELSPSRVRLNMREFIERHKRNPTMILFCLNEYDRVLWKREELLRDITEKYKSWIVSSSIENTVSYTDIERVIIIKNFKQHNNELHISVKITINKNTIIPQTKINLNLYRNGIQILKPDINSILNGLMKEYGLQMSILQIIQTVLFP